MKSIELSQKRSGMVATLIAIVLICISGVGIIFTVIEASEPFMSVVSLDFAKSKTAVGMYVDLITSADTLLISSDVDSSNRYYSSSGYYAEVKSKDGTFYSYESLLRANSGLDTIPNDCKAYIEFNTATGTVHMYSNKEEITVQNALLDYYLDKVKVDVRADMLEGQYGKDSILRAGFNDEAVNVYKFSFYSFSLLAWVFPILMLCGIVLFIFGLIAKGRKAAYARISANFTSRLFFEFKWLVLFGVCFAAIWLFMSLFGFLNGNYYSSSYPLIFIIMPTLGIALWLIFVLVRLNITDMSGGIEKYFANNFFCWLFNLLGGGSKYVWFAKRLRRILIWYTVIEAVLLFFTIIGFLSDSNGLSLLMMFLMLCCSFTFMYSAFGILSDLNKLSKKIVEISENGTSGILISPSSSVAFADSALVKIEQSCKSAAEKSMRDERTKIELITNVSHDLKTPLTSIISYTDLLSRIDGLKPEEAVEYVQVLQSKTLKLKKLIENLFELSKATTNDIEVNIETIDFSRLVRQELSYSEDAIIQSGLTFVEDISEQNALISADGSLMHAAIDNIIENALKYAMPNTRVYITLTTGENAVLSMKNVSSKPLNISADELTERFVRGESSRTTDGSGLGLAIAKTYTQLCGGKLKVYIDGDLFKVEISFPTVKEEQPPEKPETVDNTEELPQTSD